MGFHSILREALGRATWRQRADPASWSISAELGRCSGTGNGAQRRESEARAKFHPVMGCCTSSLSSSPGQL